MYLIFRCQITPGWRSNYSTIMIQRYSLDIIKKHTGPFLLCFFSLMLLLLMQFLVLHVDHLVGKGLPFAIVAELILTNLAYMVVLAVPMAVLVSTVIAFGKISEWNELTAIRAAGINPVRLIYPILGISVLFFLGLAAFSNEVLPEANHKARSLFIDIRMAKPGFDLKEGVFYEGINGYAFLVEEIDHESGTLYDLTILQEARDSRNRAFIKAKEGRLQSENERILSLILEDGQMIRYVSSGGRNEDTIERSRFSTYRMSFDLSELLFSRVNPEQRSRNDRTMSARAMLAVADSIRTQTEREFQRFLERSGQKQTMPFRRFDMTPLSPRSSFQSETPSTAQSDIQVVEAQGDTQIEAQVEAQGETLTNAQIDTRAVGETGTADQTNTPLQSTYLALNILDDPYLQKEIADRARNSSIRYDSEFVQFQGNTRHNRSRVTKYLVEVHKKWSIPFASVIFVMLGAPIGLLTRKGNLGFAALVSAVIIAIYFSSIIQGERLADRLVLTPFWGMWGINFVLFFLGLGLMGWVGRPVERIPWFKRQQSNDNVLKPS
jgi:lipopolysaccharide export system permease protein